MGSHLRQAAQGEVIELVSWRWAQPALRRICDIVNELTSSAICTDAAEDGAPWLHVDINRAGIASIMVTPELGNPTLFGLIETSADLAHVRVIAEQTEAQAIVAIVRALTVRR